MKEYHRLCLLCIVLLPEIVFAANPGFYVGGGLGLAVGPDQVLIGDDDFSSDTGGAITGQATNNYTFETRGSLLYALYAGYNFNCYVGAEANWTYLGRQDLLTFAGGITTQTGFSGELDSYYFGF